MLEQPFPPDLFVPHHAFRVLGVDVLEAPSAAAARLLERRKREPLRLRLCDGCHIEEQQQAAHALTVLVPLIAEVAIIPAIAEPDALLDHRIERRLERMLALPF